MKLKAFFLTSPLPGDEPPKEFRIWAFGEVDTLKGKFTFDAAAGQAVMAAFEDYGNELSFDYEHQAILSEGEAPAAGWYRIELRDDGLWATDIRWTPKADGYLRNKEYRYFSPAFDAGGKERRINRLVNIALTNTPATKHLTPLVAASARDLRTPAIALSMSFGDITRAITEAIQERMGQDDYAWTVDVYDDYAVFEHEGKLWQIGYRFDGSSVALIGEAVEVQRAYTPIDGGKNDMKSLLKALGLNENATEAEALVALSTLQGGAQQITTLTGKPTTPEALGTIQAWKASHDQLPTLSSRVAELEGQVLGGEVTALVEQGKKDGKVPPAMIAVLTDMGKKDLAMLKSFLEAAPKVAPDTNHNPPGDGKPPVTLSAEDQAVIAQLGIDPAKYQDHKKAQQG